LVLRAPLAAVAMDEVPPSIMGTRVDNAWINTRPTA
jgi:uncharacterized protein (DUF1786 family)